MRLASELVRATSSFCNARAELIFPRHSANDLARAELKKGEPKQQLGLSLAEPARVQPYIREYSTSSTPVHTWSEHNLCSMLCQVCRGNIRTLFLA
jgi:hypothetical protein